jgi:hypothetical protein
MKDDMGIFRAYGGALRLWLAYRALTHLRLSLHLPIGAALQLGPPMADADA